MKMTAWRRTRKKTHVSTAESTAWPSIAASRTASKLVDKLITVREINAHVRSAIRVTRTIRCPSRTRTKWSILWAFRHKSILITNQCAESLSCFIEDSSHNKYQFCHHLFHISCCCKPVRFLQFSIHKYVLHTPNMTHLLKCYDGLSEEQSLFTDNLSLLCSFSILPDESAVRWYECISRKVHSAFVFHIKKVTWVCDEMMVSKWRQNWYLKNMIFTDQLRVFKSVLTLYFLMINIKKLGYKWQWAQESERTYRFGKISMWKMRIQHLETKKNKMTEFVVLKLNNCHRNPNRK